MLSVLPIFAPGTGELVVVLLVDVLHEFVRVGKHRHGALW
jgi:hypothetical protein